MCLEVCQEGGCVKSHVQRAVILRGIRVERAGWRGGCVGRLRLGVRPLTTEGHSCSPVEGPGRRVERLGEHVKRLGEHVERVFGRCDEQLKLGVRLLTSEGHSCSCLEGLGECVERLSEQVFRQT